MNNYPDWWNTTITIYNKYEDPQTQLITWHRHIIKNCFWKYNGDKVTINDVVLDTNNIICRIPKDDAFLEKFQWVQLPNDDMDNFFTLGIGDIIIRDEVSDDINEYISGKRSSDLLSKYKMLQGCMTVEQVSNNTGVGRGQEHYLAKGI